MEIPNLLGLKLEEALYILNNNYKGIQYDIYQYSSPYCKYHIENDCSIVRVIRQRSYNEINKVELIVSHFKELVQPF